MNQTINQKDASNVSRILWAVDPFAEDKGLQAKMAQQLKAFVKNRPCAIEPVFILSPDQLRLSPDFFKGKTGEIRLEAEQKLTAYLKKIKLPGMTEPTLIVSPDYSLRMAIQACVKHAKDTGAELIAVSTHAKKGVSRMLLGSFAETLVMQSDVPVLVVSPKAKVVPSFKNVVFPTDLTDKSQHAFGQVLKLASTLKARLTIFHNASYFTPYSLDVFAGIDTYATFIEKDLERRKELLAKMKADAVKSGVKAEVILNEKPKYTPEAIVGVVKKSPDAIVALVSQTGPVATTILGSVTRDVLRQANSPVWILHPRS